MYGDKVNVRKYIKFRHCILRAEPAANFNSTGQWLVTWLNLDTHQTGTDLFNGVMVCTGHHVTPLVPTFPGQEKFRGVIHHTHGYKKPEGWGDKTVVVVGVGNSGGDAAVELSGISRKVGLIRWHVIVVVLLEKS